MISLLSFQDFFQPIHPQILSFLIEFRVRESRIECFISVWFLFQEKTRFIPRRHFVTTFSLLPQGFLTLQNNHVKYFLLVLISRSSKHQPLQYWLDPLNLRFNIYKVWEFCLHSSCAISWISVFDIDYIVWYTLFIAFFVVFTFQKKFQAEV